MGLTKLRFGVCYVNESIFQTISAIANAYSIHLQSYQGLDLNCMTSTAVRDSHLGVTV